MPASTHIYAGAAATKDGGAGGVFRRAADGDGWQHVFAKADVHAITVHPANPDVVFIGSKDGPYRSSDSGGHWERLGFPDRDMQVWSILVDRRDPNTVYAGGSPVAVYRSDDGGEHFRRMPDPDLPNRVTMSFPCRVMRFAAHPRNPGELYATLEVNGAMRSRDGGESWQDCTDDLVRLAGEPRLKSRILSDTDAEGMLDGHAVAISEADPDSVILAVRMGLFHSADHGKSWQDMQVGRFSPYTYGRDIRVSPQDPNTLYACLSVAANSQAGALFRSTDIGQTWQRFDKVEPHSTVMAVALHPRDADQVYLVARRGQAFGTTDGGKTWQDLPMPAACKDLYALACG
ncbi:MAG TPA: hypothetical protein VFW75_01775 [Acetobacteraceae bacterium]|nr:hypothetical protein [Acetobacteraceae bacterium]